jgi:taurine transport system permease protein
MFVTARVVSHAHSLPRIANNVMDSVKPTQRDYTVASAQPKQRRIKVQRTLTPFVVLLVSLGVWWLVAKLAIWPPIFVPSPEAVWQQFLKTSSLHDGIRGYNGYLLYEHLWATTRRVVLGFVFATLIGVPLGLLIGVVRPVRSALEPGVTFIRSLPPLAYFSLLIIWFGIDESPKVILLFLAAFPPIILATSDAVRGIAKDRLLAARSLGASRAQLVRYVVLPSITPELMTGLRVGLGVAFTTVVAAETVNGIPGVGGMVRDAQRFNQTDVVILGIIIIGLLGVTLDGIMRLLDTWLVPWRGRA